jgi:hypothetical protein
MNLYRATQQLAAGARGGDHEDEGSKGGGGSSDAFHFPNDEFEEWRQQKRSSRGSLGKNKRERGRWRERENERTRERENERRERGDAVVWCLFSSLHTFCSL